MDHHFWFFCEYQDCIIGSVASYTTIMSLGTIFTLIAIMLISICIIIFINLVCIYWEFHILIMYFHHYHPLSHTHQVFLCSPAIPSQICDLLFNCYCFKYTQIHTYTYMLLTPFDALSICTWLIGFAWLSRELLIFWINWLFFLSSH